MAEKIWMVAGEASGDARSAELMRSLLERRPDLRFAGAGGPKMAGMAGRPFDNWIADAGVLGLWDVLKRYGYFKAKFDSMIRAITEYTPDAVVLVDYPGFNLRLAKALRKRLPKLRVIYYVSPQVWAWNRGRIPKMAKWLDLMLCIFPFERDLYEASGLRTEFVGHPIVERLRKDRMEVPREAGLVGLFPGSREREVKRNFPVMAGAAKRILASHPETQFEAAAASGAHVDMMQAAAKAEGVAIRTVAGDAHGLMQRAGVGIVCSGTATLEAAYFGLPYALIYRTAWLTYAIGKRLVKVPHLGIANILAGRTVVREFIQDSATPGALADEMLRLMNHSEARQELADDLRHVIELLGGPGASDRAARAILETLGSEGRSREDAIPANSDNHE